MKLKGLLIFILFSTTVFAEDKQLIPLNTLLFNPTNFSIDTNGQTHVDPTLWQAGPNGLYTGRGDSLKNYRISTDSEGVVTAIANDQMIKPDSGWGRIIWNAAKFQGSNNPNLTNSPYAAALTMDKNHKVVSETQCMEGSCLTITAKSCEKFKIAAGAKTFDDLDAKIRECNDLRKVWENSFKDKDVVADVNAAFKKDIARITKSPVSSWADKPVVGLLNFKPIDAQDMSFSRSVQQMFSEGCRAHFSPDAVTAKAAPAAETPATR